MATYYIRVGFTMQRPIVVDECITYVAIIEDDGFAGAARAKCAAAQMAGVRAEMVTSTTILKQEV